MYLMKENDLCQKLEPPAHCLPVNIELVLE
jgi:hypothetical protein